MPPIYVNTDNTDKNNKVFIATKAGANSAQMEDKMKAMVEETFKDQSDFTTAKYDGAKGYTLLFEVTEFKKTGGDTTCTIKGDIVRYPSTTTKHRGKGVEKVMFGGNYSSTASASGSNGAVDCVEAIMGVLVPKSKPVMKADMARR